MPGPTAVHDLPALTWLGIRPPYVSNIRTSWSHRLPEFEYAGVDGEAHDWTGRHSLKVSFDAHFINTAEQPNNFPGKAQDFIALLTSGKSGDLRHPLIGRFNARCVDGEFELTPASSGGITIRATLTESLKDVDSATRIDTSKADMAANAAKVDTAMALLDVEYPDGMTGSTFASLAADILSFGTSLVNEVKWMVNKTVGMVDSVYEQFQITCAAAHGLSPLEKDAIAGNPFRNALEIALDAFRASLEAHLVDLLEAGRTTASYTTKSDATMAAISLELDADIAGLIQLNPTLIAKPVVPKGTTLQYFSEAA